MEPNETPGGEKRYTQPDGCISNHNDPRYLPNEEQIARFKNLTSIFTHSLISGRSELVGLFAARDKKTGKVCQVLYAHHPSGEGITCVARMFKGDPNDEITPISASELNAPPSDAELENEMRSMLENVERNIKANSADSAN